ncbi:jg15250, partial [Pararge aegeria aegeria]
MAAKIPLGTNIADGICLQDFDPNLRQSIHAIIEKEGFIKYAIDKKKF